MKLIIPILLLSLFSCGCASQPTSQATPKAELPFETPGAVVVHDDKQERAVMAIVPQSDGSWKVFEAHTEWKRPTTTLRWEGDVLQGYQGDSGTVKTMRCGPNKPGSPYLTLSPGSSSHYLTKWEDGWNYTTRGSFDGVVFRDRALYRKEKVVLRLEPSENGFAAHTSDGKKTHTVTGLKRAEAAIWLAYQELYPGEGPVAALYVEKKAPEIEAARKVH